MSRHQALDTFGRSGNPVMSDSTFSELKTTSGNTMTLEGIVNKTDTTIFINFSGHLSWNSFFKAVTLLL